jgi:hypothetical protein
VTHDHNDIYTIVERLRILEEGLTPTNVKNGLNKQQKSADQLGATFKPKTVAVLTAKTDPKNPMAGKMVGGCEESEELDENPLEETITSEDTLSKVKQSFADYLKSVADEVRQDSDLKDKKKEDTDLKKKDKQDRDLVAKLAEDADPTELSSALSGTIPAEQPPGEEGVSIKEDTPVKTITNECGLWEVHGNEKSGFEIRHGNRKLPTRFKNLDEAELALEMFNARRRKRDEAQDYIEEA